MYDVLPSFILGFHGCDASVAEAVLSGKHGLKASENSYDWLGHGIYFWESNPGRAIDWAVQQSKRKGGKIKKPAAVGAVIDLGRSLNLLDHQMITMVKEAHSTLQAIMEFLEKPMPQNRGGPDLLQRDLDCAVIEQLHAIRTAAKAKPFHTTRGVFVEGEPIYPTAGFRQKSHIQVCVRDPLCIKGYFRILPH